MEHVSGQSWGQAPRTVTRSTGEMDMANLQLDEILLSTGYPGILMDPFIADT
jgi:hypothetical protein